MTVCLVFSGCPAEESAVPNATGLPVDTLCDCKRKDRCCAAAARRQRALHRGVPEFVSALPLTRYEGWNDVEGVPAVVVIATTAAATAACTPASGARPKGRWGTQLGRPYPGSYAYSSVGCLHRLHQLLK